MARTAVTVTQLVANSEVASPAGTTVDPTNGHSISGAPLSELMLEINSTFAGAKTFTVKAGVGPTAANGDLVVSLNNATGLVGPFESDRFGQADGSLWVDVAASATGTIKAFHMPRKA